MFNFRASCVFVCVCTAAERWLKGSRSSSRSAACVTSVRSFHHRQIPSVLDSATKSMSVQHVCFSVLSQGEGRCFHNPAAYLMYRPPGLRSHLLLAVMSLQIQLKMPLLDLIPTVEGCLWKTIQPSPHFTSSGLQVPSDHLANFANSHLVFSVFWDCLLTLEAGATRCWC